MKGNTTLLVILLIIVIGVIGYVAVTQNSNDFGTATPRETSGGVAPDFLLESFDGQQIQLSDFDGKIRVVSSWATWCSLCADGLRDLSMLQQEFGNDIVVISVNRGEELEQVQQYIDNAGLGGKIIHLVDPRDSFYASIGGLSMPETIFVDASGNIKSHQRGLISLEDMTDRIFKILDATEQ